MKDKMLLIKYYGSYGYIKESKNGECKDYLCELLANRFTYNRMSIMKSTTIDTKLKPLSKKFPLLICDCNKNTITIQDVDDPIDESVLNNLYCKYVEHRDSCILYLDPISFNDFFVQFCKYSLSDIFIFITLFCNETVRNYFYQKIMNISNIKIEFNSTYKYNDFISYANASTKHKVSSEVENIYQIVNNFISKYLNDETYKETIDKIFNGMSNDIDNLNQYHEIYTFFNCGSVYERWDDSLYLGYFVDD